MRQEKRANDSRLVGTRHSPTHFTPHDEELGNE
jgi:hypothetical protein